jgi:hypothetical protein
MDKKEMKLGSKVLKMEKKYGKTLFGMDDGNKPNYPKPDIKPVPTKRWKNVN